MATPEELLEKAAASVPNSYSPYSGFKVAAVIETASGSLFTGVNIESASFRLTICAEQAAVAAALTAGEKDLKKILIHTPDAKNIVPCGACLQMLSEFVGDLTIYLAGATGAIKETSLSELLTSSFKFGS